MTSITHIGLDVHKQTIAVAMLEPGHTQATAWQLANEPAAVRRLIRKLKKRAPVSCAYIFPGTRYCIRPLYMKDSLNMW